MMLKFGRNIGWVEILWNFKNFDDVISNSKVWPHNRHFDVATTQELKLNWIKLTFGVRGNFMLLISNLNSNMQYQFEILTKYHFSSLRSWFLPSTPSWIGYHGNNEWPIFNLLISKTSTYNCLKMKCFWYIQPKPSKSYILSAVAFWWRHKINMTMTSSNIFANL